MNNMSSSPGGPVGFLAGVKIGGLAAVGGSILGYTGASVVRYAAFFYFLIHSLSCTFSLFLSSPLSLFLPSFLSFSGQIQDWQAGGGFILSYFGASVVRYLSLSLYLSFCSFHFSQFFARPLSLSMAL